MPADTVYLAVVDPGSARSGGSWPYGPTAGRMLVGPDNGLLVPAAESLGGISAAVCAHRGALSPASRLQHLPRPRRLRPGGGASCGRGRASRSSGRPWTLPRCAVCGPASVADRGGSWSRPPASSPSTASATPGSPSSQEESGLEYGDALKVDAGDGEMSVRYVETFGSAKAGELVLVPDSHWRLSLAINKGNAAQALALEVGGTVRLIPPNGPRCLNAATPGRVRWRTREPLPSRPRSETGCCGPRPCARSTSSILVIGAGVFVTTLAWWLLPSDARHVRLPGLPGRERPDLPAQGPRREQRAPRDLAARHTEPRRLSRASGPLAPPRGDPPEGGGRPRGLPQGRRRHRGPPTT